MQYKLSNPELLKQLLNTIPLEDICVEWPRSKNLQGYGQFRTWDDSGENLVHRQSWIETNGPIPPGLLVLHKCDNPPCLRPSHLFLGTQKDNMADCSTKGRIGSPPKYLSAENRAEVRRLYESGVKQRVLAVQFNVSQGVIFDACIGCPKAGQRNGINSKYTEDQIREIRRLNNEGMKQTEIAALFGMKQGAVSNIVRRKAWAWVQS